MDRGSIVGDVDNFGNRDQVSRLAPWRRLADLVNAAAGERDYGRTL
jgi:hypothetical protein